MADSKHEIIYKTYKPLFEESKTPQKMNSLSNQFRGQLNDLLYLLNTSTPKFVRCIKPNNNRSSSQFESFDVNK